jgi:hypothetical protein
MASSQLLEPTNLSSQSCLTRLSLAAIESETKIP